MSAYGFQVYNAFTKKQRACPCTIYFLTVYAELYGWRRGVVVSGDRRMNEVNARRARLLPGWVTVFGRVYHLGM